MITRPEIILALLFNNGFDTVFMPVKTVSVTKLYIFLVEKEYFSVFCAAKQKYQRDKSIKRSSIKSNPKT